ncbi:MAG: indolepyruvate oxidoreductase subunit beta [Bacteroidales bacterium]|nr:indolepyruvate oxidoreductase subunit beta [Bacteroidales bacterium]
MKKDIILSGVGGQGIISIASIIGYTALQKNLHLKQSEVHGMSQRGGAVMSNLRISDKPIASDLIPFGKADVIISVEPMECLRYLPYLSPDGWLITNLKPFVNIPNYPEMEAILAEIKKVKNHVILNADDIAAEIKAKRSMNTVMLGAAAPFLGFTTEDFEIGIRGIFGGKGEEIVQQNIDALNAGLKEAEKFYK